MELEQSRIIEKKQTVIYSQNLEALKKWIVCLLFVAGSIYLFYRGLAIKKINYLIISVTTFLFFGYHFFHYSRFLFKRKPFLIFDQIGMYNENGSFRVKWEEIRNVYYARAKTFDHVGIRTKSHETILLCTYNVVSMEEFAATLKEYGIKIG
jgi:hypothetical protein